MTRWSRSRLRAGLGMTMLALTLSLTAAPAPVLAQEAEPLPGAEGEKKEGRTLDGYLAAGCLAGLAMFIVGKTARRS